MIYLNYPKISIVVPVYNLDKYVETTVNSLLAQTYKNNEIILVDDGSTDNSPEICDRLAKAHSNVKSLHISNSGVSAARNAGMAAAEGEYIGFCDADDTIDSDMYEFLYNLVQKDNADIALCEVRFILQDGTLRNIATGKYQVWHNTQDFLVDFFSGNVKMGVATKLFSKKICDKIKFPEGYRTNEDKYFTFLAALHAKNISSKNDAKYNYYRHSGSSSFTEFNSKYFDCIKLADKMLDTTKKLYPELAENAMCNRLATVLRIYKLMYQRNGLTKYKSETDSMLEYVRNFDIKIAKKHLGKNDFIRYTALKKSTVLFKLMTKLFDRY